MRPAIFPALAPALALTLGAGATADTVADLAAARQLFDANLAAIAARDRDA